MLRMSQSRVLVCTLYVAGMAVATAEFVTIQANKSPYHNAVLPRAHNMGINYTAVAYNWTQSQLPNFALSLDFEFGSLAEPQFDALMHTYSGWSLSGGSTVHNSGAGVIASELGRECRASELA